jgi:hypothetical protein
MAVVQEGKMRRDAGTANGAVEHPAILATIVVRRFAGRRVTANREKQRQTA